MPNAFDFVWAERLARASDFAYHRDFKRQPELSAAVHQLIQQGTSFASILVRNDAIIVAFRGTEPSVPDWLGNFQAHLVDFAISGLASKVPGRVHDGFLNELQAIWPELLKAVLVPVQAGKPLYITGHSQGAAIAVLATAAFRATHIPVAATYAFAPPRPGDVIFRTYLDDQTIHRVELGDDIVPHVPPTIPPLLVSALKLASIGAPAATKRLLSLVNKDYVSVGALAYGQVREFVVPELTSVQEAHLFDSRLRRLFIAGNAVVADHTVINYVDAVNKY